MASEFTSAFDDLLAKNEGQMDALLGVRSSPQPKAPSAAPVQPQAPPEAGSSTISGTANGIPFKLTTK